MYGFAAFNLSEPLFNTSHISTFCAYKIYCILVLFISLINYIISIIDHTTNQGKGSIKERNESAFAVAIDALTYQSPVTRGAGGSRK